MILTGSVKALLISLFISAVILISLIGITIGQEKPYTYIKDDLFVEILIEAEEIEIVKLETNLAFNSNKTNNRHTKAYNYIPPAEDFEYISSTTSDINEKEENKIYKQLENKPKNLQKEQFITINKILKASKDDSKSNNKNSSVSYSLLNREAISIPVPVYLCDASGKVNISITVNANGKVVKASINSSVSVKNNCLQERALQYAKRARFNSSQTINQLGSITYLFQ
ncbi:energy transducer TonB [Aurantibacter sp.]|uniref:energy transducer TonB family protein n=1 Tax=Aurantibacter sp. TaxID=2807103 RepID=UPI0035C79E93